MVIAGGIGVSRTSPIKSRNTIVQSSVALIANYRKKKTGLKSGQNLPLLRPVFDWIQVHLSFASYRVANVSGKNHIVIKPSSQAPKKNVMAAGS
jgi:hypothetical protein